MTQPEVKVSESVTGVSGPAMAQAMREFQGRAPDAPASLGKPLYNAYLLEEQRRHNELMDTYRVRGSGYHAREAAQGFYDEEFRSDWDMGLEG